MPLFAQIEQFTVREIGRRQGEDIHSGRAYTLAMGMHYCQQGAVKHTHYVVRCKGCARDVPSGCSSFPTDNVVVRCELCGELRRYRPSEVYLGTPHMRMVAK